MSETPHRQQCAQQVFTESRMVSGHRCGNYAQPGSDYCRVHMPKEPGKPQPSRSAPATITSMTRRSYFATLGWEPGQGPVVPIPYRRDGAMGFITAAKAKATDDGPASLEVRGYVQKKDGTPGLQPWDASFQAADLLGEWTAVLLAKLEEERTHG